MDWQIFTLPFDENYVQNLKFTSGEKTQPGTFFKGEFDLATTGDTYLDVSSWEKGVVWVNGHNLGRYWNIGPQKQLYCPAPWLKKGKNEIVIFDMHQLSPKPVKGMKSME
jgi:beta-galactosidase